MYEIFFEERELIPEGQFHELSFRSLVNDPLEEMRRLYQQLNLPDYSAVQPALERYVARIADYRGHQYAQIPPAPLQRQIAQSWRQCFTAWGYGY